MTTRPSIQLAPDPEVALRRGALGGELRIALMRMDGPDTLQAALQLGFSSALAFDAGLACDEDGRWLLLTRWIDDADDSALVAAASAELVEQRAAWRALLPRSDDGAARLARRSSEELRQRQRLHSLLGQPSP